MKLTINSLQKICQRVHALKDVSLTLENGMFACSAQRCGQSSYAYYSYLAGSNAAVYILDDLDVLK